MALVFGAPVVVVSSGGIPVVNTMSPLATPLVVVASLGATITVVERDGVPVTLYDEAGELWVAP